MKRILIVSLVALASLGLVQARHEQPYRIVFDLTSRDTLEQRAVLRWIREESESSPAQMEVVMYAKGFELVMPERSTYLNEVKEAIKRPNVTFKVCAVALRNNNVTQSQLLPGVEVVPDGIREIVDKQRADWGYIKVMH